MEYVKSDIKLTIGMLVSDRKKYIRQVMESIRPLLQLVSSELIVVDTKGEAGDGSIEIVKEYTEHIHYFKWCNDFAAARNCYMENAKGEWIFTLDDDECLDEDISELVDFFTSGKSDCYGAAYCTVMNHLENGGVGTNIGGRLIRRTVNTRYVGRVHEYFNEVYEPYITLSTVIHHYGYAFSNEEEKKKHQERNVTLLQMEIEAEGASPRMCAQLMQELLSRRETKEKALQVFETNIPVLVRQNKVMDACTQWMLVASVRCFTKSENYERLLAQAEKVITTYPLSEVAQLALAGVVVENAAPIGNVFAILTYAPIYKAAWEWLKTHDKESISQKQLDFTNYCTVNYAIQVFQVAATCANAVKDYATAYEYWQELPWDMPEFDGSKYLKGMQETLAGLEANIKK